MSECPYCDTEYIEGADFCAQCGMSLSDMHLTLPGTALEKSLLRDPLSVLNPRQPLVVPLTTTVREVLQFLIEKKIGCAFVVDGDGGIVGVFTERDAYRRLGAEAAEHFDRPITDFMTANPRTLRSDAKIAFAVRMMDLGGYRHILTVDENGRPDGVTSVRDLLKYLTKQLASDPA